MLVNYSLLSKVEVAIVCESKHVKQDVLCDWVTGETWQMCPKRVDEFRGGCKKIGLTTEDNHLCRQKFPKGSSKCSTFNSTTFNSKSKRSSPDLVYKRRKSRRSTVSSLPGQGQGSTRRSGETFSIVSFNTPLVTTKGVLNQSSVPKMLEVDSVHDSCSSSKSNAEQVLSSIKIEVDETSECSSSSAVVMDYLGDDLSEKEFCIHVLRSHGLLERDFSSRSCTSSEVNGANSGNSYRRSCKICGRSDSTIKLLICDHCEEAFHLSCCNPRMKKAPVDEWFCHSCMKKREQILKDKVRRKLFYVTSELSGYKSLSSKGKTSPVALMLKDIEPRTTRVRIGKDFQAEVPEWSGPIENDDDDIGKPLEVHPSQFASLLESKPNDYKCSSSHNWLQCRAALDGSGETICGKWRRAPPFEVQTDEWECYSSVLWDPRYADCAVPQELKTYKVLGQLKYSEKLRPRTWEKRQISSDHTKHYGNS